MATPSPGGRVATANLPPLGGLTESVTAPSGLRAHTLNVLEDFDSDDDFRWDGDETGADYVAHSSESNNSTALYPSCCSVALHPLPHVNPFELPKATPNSLTKPSSSPTDARTTNGIITLSRHLRQLYNGSPMPPLVVSCLNALPWLTPVNQPHASRESHLHLI